MKLLSNLNVKISLEAKAKCVMSFEDASTSERLFSLLFSSVTTELEVYSLSVRGVISDGTVLRMDLIRHSHAPTR